MWMPPRTLIVSSKGVLSYKITGKDWTTCQKLVEGLVWSPSPDKTVTDQAVKSLKDLLKASSNSSITYPTKNLPCTQSTTSPLKTTLFLKITPSKGRWLCPIRLQPLIKKTWLRGYQALIPNSINKGINQTRELLMNNRRQRFELKNLILRKRKSPLMKTKRTNLPSLSSASLLELRSIKDPGDPCPPTYSSAKKKGKNLRNSILSGIQVKSWSKWVSCGKECLVTKRKSSRSNRRRTESDMKIRGKSSCTRNRRKIA